MTIKYTNSISKARKIANDMKFNEPDYENDVIIGETHKEEFGAYARVDLGKYVIMNETEWYKNENN